MFVRKDRSANDRQVSVWTYEIVRKLSNKVEKLLKCRTVYYHRRMLLIEKDTMLVVINIWGILKSPVCAVYFKGYNTVVLSCRGVHSSCISHVLIAQQALRISRLLCKLCRCNGFRVFFRLGKIDSYIKVAVLCWSYPAHIFLNSVSSYVVRVLRKLVEIVSCDLCRLVVVKSPELCVYLWRSWSKKPHEFCVEKISVYNRIFCKALFHSVIEKLFEV